MSPEVVAEWRYRNGVEGKSGERVEVEELQKTVHTVAWLILGLPSTNRDGYCGIPLFLNPVTPCRRDVVMAAITGV